MATLVERIRTKLMANSTLLGMVGDRIHALVVPQGSVYPVIVLTVLGETTFNTQDPTRDTNLCQSSLQVDCYSERYEEAHAVMARVDSIIGVLADPNDLVTQRDVTLDGYEDLTELYRVTTDYSVFHGVEPVP